MSVFSPLQENPCKAKHTERRKGLNFTAQVSTTVMETYSWIPGVPIHSASFGKNSGANWESSQHSSEDNGSKESCEHYYTKNIWHRQG